MRAVGKRPVMPTGDPASSTSPDTWSAYSEVQVGAGDGVGVMLGGGLGCYDLDHMGVGEVREFISAISEPVIYVERSMSGNGAHVFIKAPESRGWKRGRVERYTWGRFIRMTFDRIAL